jgi:hypothetical protein
LSRPRFLFLFPRLPERSIRRSHRKEPPLAVEGPGGPVGGFFRFCHSDDFHGSWAWNPEDVTDPGTHEYGIYLLGADGYDGPHKVASTFHEFVMSYVLGGGFHREEEPWKCEPGEQGLPDAIGFFQVIR